MNNTAIGVSIMLVATSMTNVGGVMQKKAVDGMPAFGGRSVLASVRALILSPVWMAGWVLTTAAVVLNMLALGYADISVIQPLNGFGLVVLAITSRILLGERLGRASAAGMGAVIAGVGLIGFAAPSSRLFGEPAEIFACYLQPAAVALVGALLAGMLLMAWAARRWPRAAGPLYSLVAAMLSVAGLTFAKGYFGIVTLTGVGATLALGWAYPLLALLFSFAVAALVVQQLSFQKGRATVVTPIFAAASVVLPLLTGRWVFDETLSAASVAALPFIILGVLLLGARGRGEERGVPAPVVEA